MVDRLFLSGAAAVCGAGGANNVVSEADAKAMGKLPCPVCVQEAADPQGVRAVARAAPMCSG